MRRQVPVRSFVQMVLLVVLTTVASSLASVLALADTRDAAISDDVSVGSAKGEISSSVARSTDLSWRRAKETKFAYKLGSGFDSFANEREQSQFFGFGVTGDFQAQLMSSLAFRVKAGADLSSGYAQSRFGDNVGKSGIYLQEAVMSLRAVETSLVRAYAAGGALDQGAFGAPLFVARQAFPGVKETIVIGNSEALKLRVWAQQAIPTSKTLSTKTVDAEVTPAFTTETVELQVQPAEVVKAKAAITHFTFNNLPSAIAQESILYGNSVDEVGPNTSRFKYRFDGMLAQAGVTFDLFPNFSWNFGGYAIQNAAAPEGYRNGQVLQTGFKIGIPGEIDLMPSASTFFIEDDAVPGFYNSSYAGHNNRHGFSAALEAFFQRQRFKLRAEFIDADLINFNLYQSRQQTLSIGFETFYEML